MMEERDVSDDRHVALWSVALSALRGTPWEDEDEERAGAASGGVDLSECARVMRAAYGNELMQDEEAVRATLRACVERWGQRFAPEQFGQMAHGYTAYFADMHVALREWLDDLYGAGELDTRWFREDAPVWDAPRRESEIWISGEQAGAAPEGEPAGSRRLDEPQWVFRRPD